MYKDRLDKFDRTGVIPIHWLEYCYRRVKQASKLKTEQHVLRLLIVDSEIEIDPHQQ